MSFKTTSTLMGSLGLLMLAACGAGDEAGELTAPPVPPTPPATEATLNEAAAPEVPDAPVAVDTAAAAEDDHGEEDHAHDDHDHDHGDHDHAGGEAHVHGAAEMAVARDGSRLTVTFESPTANFGYSEAESDLPEDNTVGEDTFALIGGECLTEMTNVSAETDGQHGSVTVEKRYICSNIESVTAIRVTAFEAFPGFESVDAVYLTDSDQIAAELTADNPELVIN